MSRSPFRRTLRVLAHGGAGRRRPTQIQQARLSESLLLGIQLLQSGRPALEAVQAMIQLLENSGLFNAGAGACRQLDGRQRMDAALMEGATLRAGGVAGLEGFRHPIIAARLVMDETDHVLLVGHQAGRFAKFFELAKLPRRTLDLSPAGRRRSAGQIGKSAALFRKMAHYGTVGAVALDQAGHVAAGASTGGVPIMLPGRVGDSPVVGAGLYADDRAGAVSMTGIGEGIMRLALAKQIILLMKNGRSPAQAARVSLQELVMRVRGEAGCIALAPDGRYTIQHVTPFMLAGQWDGRGQPVVFSCFPRKRSPAP